MKKINSFQNFGICQDEKKTVIVDFFDNIYLFLKKIMKTYFVFLGFFLFFLCNYGFLEMSKEIKEAYTIQAQDLQERMMFVVQLLEPNK